MVVEDMRPVLAVAGILRDTVDDICEGTEALLAKMEAHKQRLESYGDASLLSGPDAIESTVEELGPERMAALLAAFDSMDELTVLLDPDSEYAQQAKHNMEILKKVRAHLHTALDGVVP